MEEWGKKDRVGVIREGKEKDQRSRGQRSKENIENKNQKVKGQIIGVGKSGSIVGVPP